MKENVAKLESLVPWARSMARMRARACTISAQLGLSPVVAKRIWTEENGKSSPSGLQPSHVGWYLKTPERRYQSSLLIALNQMALQKYPSSIAFTHAYYHFSRLTASEWGDRGEGDPAFRTAESDYTIPYSRGFMLVKLYHDELYEDKTRKCDLILRACRTCRGKYLSHKDEAGGKCPLCIGH
jgi:hypothetical protein